MCTAISIKNKHHYFGRTLDIEYDIIRDVVITPRNYTFDFKNAHVINNHPAMIGAATISDNYPLYYEATNESGLSVAGLNFTHSSCFDREPKRLYGIETYELIPWILCQCTTVKEAVILLHQTNIKCNGFNSQYKGARLHWMISDKNNSIVLESTSEGIEIYGNPLGILTNEPSFEFHLSNIKNYINLSPHSPPSVCFNGADFSAYSNGMGAIGLPGDMSSASRFVRAAFIKFNSKIGESEEDDISLFFHTMENIAQIEGCVVVNDTAYEKTVYTSCCNTDTGMYYYTTAENRQITGIDMYGEALDSDKLIKYHMKRNQNICYQNKQQSSNE